MTRLATPLAVRCFRLHVCFGGRFRVTMPGRGRLRRVARIPLRNCQVSLRVGDFGPKDRVLSTQHDHFGQQGLELLAGWLGGLDRYAKSKGGDEPAFLSMYDGDSISVDRRTGTPRYLFVPSAIVSICGTIQPRVLPRTMGRDRRDSGMLGRFLLACPPRRQREWSDDSVPEELRDRVREVFDVLNGMEPARDSLGDEFPATIRLDDDARNEFIAYFRRNAERMDVSSGDELAALAKLEATAARLALVIHLVRQAAGDDVDPWDLDRDSMLSGVTLAEWFCAETTRVYAILAESGPTTDRRRLVDWLARNGGRATARDVSRGCGWLRKAEKAEAALAELVESGTGRWELPPHCDGAGRQPARVFVRRPATTRIVSKSRKVDASKRLRQNRATKGSDFASGPHRTQRNDIEPNRSEPMNATTYRRFVATFRQDRQNDGTGPRPPPVKRYFRRLPGVRLAVDEWQSSRTRTTEIRLPHPS